MTSEQLYISVMKVPRSALDWHFDKHLFVVGLDADCAHRILICVSLD